MNGYAADKVAEVVEQTCSIASVWERHPDTSKQEQDPHFVRRKTDLLKMVDAMGLEDSTEWHRANYHKFMHDEPFDRAILINSKKHYEDLQAHFPDMKHYWAEEGSTFGEQLIIDGLDADSICLGDILESKDTFLKLQVTSPRLCCFRTDHRYPAIPAVKISGQKGTVRQWASSNSRAGFFCKVIRPGTVQEGHSFVLRPGRFQSYPLSYLAELCYMEKPTAINFTGNDAQLMELCDAEDFAMFEWRERLIDFRAHKKSGIQALPEHMGNPIPYEEGLKLITGEWCSLGSANPNNVHERNAGMDVEHIRSQVESEIALKLEGDVVHSSAAVLENKHICAKVRNDHGNFAMEIDLGGFPAFPRYAFMTRFGHVDDVYLMISTGGKWRRIPDDV